MDTAHGSTYLSLFAQEKTPLDKFLEGDKLFLSPRTDSKALFNLTHILNATEAVRLKLEGYLNWAQPRINKRSKTRFRFHGNRAIDIHFNSDGTFKKYVLVPKKTSTTGRFYQPQVVYWLYTLVVKPHFGGDGCCR